MRYSVRLFLLVALGSTTISLGGSSASFGAPNDSRDGLRRVVVQLVEGSDITLSGQSFAGRDATRIAEIADVIATHHVRRVARLFSRAERDLGNDRARARRIAGRRPPDLNLFFAFEVPDDTTAELVASKLSALAIVESAYVAPLPAPPPTTPDFEPDQHYLDSPPDGIDARSLRVIPGGRGNGIRVVDVEYSWNTSHEDLPLGLASRVLVLPGQRASDPFNNDDHGTAVLGEIVALENNLGVTGIVPASEAWLAPVYVDGWWNVADAISRATEILSPGDVILIEQQTFGPAPSFSYVPVEWNIAEFAAIRTATQLGIVVVEAAGNGSQNLDDPVYQGNFDRTLRDSGAILVGAGASPGGAIPARSRLAFSNWGSRVDVQGWGNSVVTTGYGTLQAGVDRNRWYTSGFSGTSSASPLAAGAIAAIQALRREQGEPPLEPEQIRDQVACRGTRQTDSLTALATSEWIGPLPNAYGTASPTCSQPGPRPGRDPGTLPGKDIWTTSVYSYAQSSPYPGGGRDDGDLRVGGWGDLYYSLIEFDLAGLPPRSGPTPGYPFQAYIELYCHSDDSGVTVPMYLDRITSPWSWVDRLWWADRPSTASWRPGALPAPMVGGWYAIDVSDLYNAWQTGAVQNFGIELIPTSSSNEFNFFFSSDSKVDPRLRPRLVVYRDARPTACSDGMDNDGDGRVDYPDDAGCTALIDYSERSACSDGLDDDGDGLVDYPADPGCQNADSKIENPECQDGLDNDQQTGIDFDGGASLRGGVPISTADPQCTAAYRNTERSCGLGAELALVMPLLGLAASRTRRANYSNPAPA